MLWARTGVSSVTFVGFDGCDHVGAAREALDPVRDWLLDRLPPAARRPRPGPDEDGS